MAERILPNLDPLPSSQFAAELRRGPCTRPFEAPLEAEFTRLRLAENRTLIRVTALLALLMTTARGADQLLADVWNDLQIAKYGAVLGASLLLALAACGPWFQRVYLRAAEVLVPVRNVFAAATVAGVAADGQVEALMLLPPLVIGPFFALGLPFRASAVTVVLTLLVFVGAAVTHGLAPPLTMRSSLLLLTLAVGCAVVARTYERVSRKSFLESRIISELAERDALTGLKNRRLFDDGLETLWQRAIAERRGIVVLLIDVDHFKAFNDRYGHQAGDRALRRVAQALQALVTRPSDLLVRYGGEEFAVLLYDVDAVEGKALAERMRLAVAGLALPHAETMAKVVTISAGVALVDPSRKRSATGALQLADQALYEAKKRGRNRVEVLDQHAHQALQTGVFARAGLGA